MGLGCSSDTPSVAVMRAPARVAVRRHESGHRCRPWNGTADAMAAYGRTRRLGPQPERELAVVHVLALLPLLVPVQSAVGRLALGPLLLDVAAEAVVLVGAHYVDRVALGELRVALDDEQVLVVALAGAGR